MTRALRNKYEHVDNCRSYLPISDYRNSLEEVRKARADALEALDLCKDIEPDTVSIKMTLEAPTELGPTPESMLLTKSVEKVGDNTVGSAPNKDITISWNALLAEEANSHMTEVYDRWRQYRQGLRGM